jgi:hypothetical protein
MFSAVEMLGTALIALGLSLSLLAQEPEPPTERVAPPVSGITALDSGPPADAARPDTAPLTGFLPLTVGSFGTERSFVAPSFTFSQTADSNPMFLAGPSGTVAATNLGANLLLQQIWRGSQFSLNYTGGGSLYAGYSDLNSIFQGARIRQSFQHRRWSLTVADDVTYTSESAFGYSALSSLGGSSFISGIAPNQSVLTYQTDQVTSTTVGQVNYSLNKRSSITVAADFGVQRFLSGGLTDSNQGGILVGYNYNLNPRDSLGLSYGVTSVRCTGALSCPKLDSHNVQLAYGRRITGRLALLFSAGPGVDLISEPSLGSVSQLTWTAQSSLLYRFRRVEVNLSYNHSIIGGAGVLYLAKTDQILTGFTTRLTRTLSGSFNAGYAHNNNLQGVVVTPNSAFDTAFFNTTLRRPLGRETIGFLTYTFQHQSANGSTCEPAWCGDRHIGGVGFEWHMRPLLLR